MREMLTFKDKPISLSMRYHHGKSPRRYRRIAGLILLSIVIYMTFHALSSNTTTTTKSRPKIQQQGNSNVDRILNQLPNLRKSLVLAPSGKSSSPNKNILFIASNPSAASLIANSACEFADQGDAVVNFAIVGSPNLDIPAFLSMNHINAYSSKKMSNDDCKIHFHDARSLDMFGSASPTVVSNSLGLLLGLIDPVAVLWSPEAENDSKFVDVALKFFEANPRFNLIDLNPSMIKDLQWLPLLSVSALSSWPSFQLDIIIKISHHVGDTFRLVGQIAKTDFLGLEYPRLIIEIDDEDAIDRNFPDFISSLNYPNDKIFVQIKPSNVKLSTIYPVSNNRCVVNLSPDYQLSKYWFHWLVFNLIQYKDTGIAGVSLVPLKKTTNNLPNNNNNSIIIAQESSNVGIAYYPQVWRQIYSYIVHKNNQVINIPNSEKKTLSSIDEAIILQGYAIIYPPIENGMFAFQHNDFENGIESTIAGDLVRLDALTPSDLSCEKTPVLDYMGNIMTSTDTEQDEDSSLEETQEFHNFNSPNDDTTTTTTSPSIKDVNKSIQRRLKSSLLSLKRESDDIRSEINPQCNTLSLNDDDKSYDINDPWDDIFCLPPSNDLADGGGVPQPQPTSQSLKL